MSRRSKLALYRKLWRVLGADPAVHLGGPGALLLRVLAARGRSAAWKETGTAYLFQRLELPWCRHAVCAETGGLSPFRAPEEFCHGLLGIVGGTVTIGILSQRFLEDPFLRLKRDFV